MTDVPHSSVCMYEPPMTMNRQHLFSYHPLAFHSSLRIEPVQIERQEREHALEAGVVQTVVLQADEFVMELADESDLGAFSHFT